MGRTVIGHLLQSPLVTAIVAYDPSPTSLRLALEAGAVRATADLQEVLDDPEVALVFITAANHAHHDLAIAALRAGKAVMCEKPMATTLEEATAMVEEAERLGQFLQIGYELRYSRLYSTIKEWIDRGDLGEIRNIQCNYICGEFWGRDSWRIYAKGSGTMFGEKLCHYVDLPRWWVGSEVEEVYSLSSPNVIPYYEIRDNYQATYRFANGAASHLTFMMPFASTSEGDPLQDRIDQQKDDGHELRYLVMGSKGGAATDLFRRTIRRWVYGENEKGFTSTIVEEIRWKPEEDHLFYHNTFDQTHDIVQRVAQGLPPRLSPRDALETMKLCSAADLSVNEGRTVRLEELETGSHERLKTAL